MSTRYECDRCGVAECDLPDGVDRSLIFESNARGTFCQGCYWGYEATNSAECCASGRCEVCTPGGGWS